ncbi:peptidase domain-containing ABC transporter [Companilactobacillus metriopterae]|uniref:peptidase domain-containing ABC transporter n=1 Tax=Companilactobacillus metriopterae TaxID=1909267 RepID=UPI00100B7EBB|nr:peptidase domain-containing ABC transporter [Companilactobacillus metriopterae]
MKKLKITLQGEHSECGMACISSILNYHGLDYSLLKLTNEFGIPRGGLTFQNIYEILKVKGLDSISMNTKNRTSIPVPSIALWNENHFVIIEKILKNRVLIMNPSSGKQWIPINEYLNKFSGKFIYSKFDSQKKSKLVENKIKKNSYLETIFKSFTLDWVKLTLVTIFFQFSLLTIPILSQRIIDVISSGQKLNYYFLIIFIVSIFIIVYILQKSKNTILAKLRKKIDEKLMSEFYSKLLKMPLIFFSNRSTGELIFRSNLNIYIRQVMSQNLISLLVDSLFLFIYLILMLRYSILLTVVTAVITIFISIIMIINANQIKKIVDVEITFQGRVQKILTESISGIETLKSQHAENSFFESWFKNFKEQLDVSLKKDLYIAKYGILTDLMQNFAPFILIIFASTQIENNNMSMGTLVAFLSLLGMFMSPVIGLASAYNDLSVLKIYIGKLDEVLDYKFDNDNCIVSQNEKNENYKIILDNITYRNSLFETPIIDNLYLEISKGEKIALVGKSGSGKTTLLKLLSQSIQPTYGKSYIINDSGYKEFDYSNDVFMVNQHSQLFSGTLKENIHLTYDDELINFNIERINHASRLSQVDEIIKSIPIGLDTIVSENGNNFSGGQQQKISIARAFFSNYPIILFDEATSAIDKVSENQILKNILEYKEATIISITHKINMIKKFDKIIVMDSGKINAIGRHEELINSNKIYKDLYRESVELNNEEFDR